MDSWLIVCWEPSQQILMISMVFWVAILLNHDWVQETRHSKLYDGRSDWIGFDIVFLTMGKFFFLAQFIIHRLSNRLLKFRYMISEHSPWSKIQLVERSEIKRLAFASISSKISPQTRWVECQGAKSPRCSSWDPNDPKKRCW